MTITPFAPVIPGADFSQDGVFIPRDKGMNGAVFAFDFKDPICWPTQGAAVASDVFKNMVDGGADAVAQGAVPWRTDSLRFSISDNQQVDLPDAARFTGNTEGFVVLISVGSEAQSQATKSRVAGYFDGTDNTGPWGIYVESNFFRFVVNSQIVTGSSPSGWMATGVAHEIALAWFKDETDEWRVAVWADGVEIANVAALYDTIQAPTNATEPGLGDSATDGMSRYFTGSIGRVIGNDLGQTQRSVAEIVARDWAVAQDRFASFE